MIAKNNESSQTRKRIQKRNSTVKSGRHMGELPARTRPIGMMTEQQKKTRPRGSWTGNPTWKPQRSLLHHLLHRLRFTASEGQVAAVHRRDRRCPHLKRRGRNPG